PPANAGTISVSGSTLSYVAAAGAANRVIAGVRAGSVSIADGAGPIGGSCPGTVANGVVTCTGTFDTVRILLGDGDDSATVTVPGSGAPGVTVDGGDGDDTIVIDPVSGRAASPVAVAADSTGLGVTVIGGRGDDTVKGGPGGDNVAGGDGNDSVKGGGGN